MGFYSGGSISYLAGYFFAGRETDVQGIVPSIIFNLGSLEIHLHHWLVSSMLLVLLILPMYLKGKINPPLFLFTFGFFLGLIIHGVFSYSDWNDIFERKLYDIRISVGP